MADKHRAVLATRRQDGGVQMSPVTVALDAEGRPVISTRQTAYKVKNLRRDPQVSLCVFSDGFFGEWVQIDGTATIVELPEAMERDQRVLVRIEITRAGPDREG